MKYKTRRKFLKQIAGYLAFSWLTPVSKLFAKNKVAHADPVAHIYVSKNGTPVTNMKKVIQMAGGIQRFVDEDDAVVIKPNLQWRNQGYTHTLATKTLIEIILQRPGGFTGEILIAEDHVSFTRTDQGWYATPENRLNNWPDMNYREMIEDFQARGYPNVTAAPITNDTDNAINGPQDGPGYVYHYYTTANSPGANGRYTRIGYPILQSSYSGKMMDTKNGVWEAGDYTGQNVKLLFLPTLNAHSSYAGITSAVKCHVGFVPLGGGG